MASVLKFDGLVVDRPANRVALDALTLSLEGWDVLEFSQVAATLPGSYSAAKPVELEVDGTTRFKGRLVSTHYQGIGDGAIRIGYRAFGLEWLANSVPLAAIDGTGNVAYDLTPEDDDYLPTLAGKSVGEIIADVLDRHAAALAAVGVLGYEADDLAALTVVPPEPVALNGGLWGMVRALVARWCNKYACWIDPADGKVKVKSRLGGLTPLTLTLDSDPVTVESISRDHSECAGRVKIRGGPDVQAAFLAAGDGTWEKGWSPAAEAAWTYADFLQPRDSADLGTVTDLSSTTVTVKSDVAARTWAVNFWSGIGAEIVAYDPLATGIAFGESRRITACTALSAGGTSVLTLDAPLSNSGYTRYSIRGLYSDAAKVWRRIVPTNAWVREHLVKRFSHSQPWSPVDGSVVQTTAPQAVVCHSATGAPPWNEFPVTFEVDPADGSLWFHEPIVKPFSSMASLMAGTPDGVPNEVKILVPYSRGALTVSVPETGFQGTAFAVDGLEREAVRDYPGWLDYRDRTSYAQLASEILDTAKDAVVEGALVHHGKLSAVLSKGVALSIAGNGYATGFETAAATVMQVALDFAPDGGSASRWTTRVGFSNRMRPFTGDRLYVHPSFAANPWRQDAGLDREGSAAQIAARKAGFANVDEQADQRAAGTARAKSLDDPNAFMDRAFEDGPAPFLPGDGRDGTNSYKGPRKAKSLGNGDLARVMGSESVPLDEEYASNKRHMAAEAAADKTSPANVAAARLRHAMGLDVAPEDKAIDAELKRLADRDDRDAPRIGGGMEGLAYP